MRMVSRDSEEARNVLELASFQTDLAEATSAIELALGSLDGEAENKEEVAKYFAYAAVVAYSRCFTASSVRRNLDKIVELPPRLVPTHELARSLRNATVAHSQSNLTEAFLLTALDRKDGVIEARPSLVVRMGKYVPRLRMTEFQTLFKEVADLVDEKVAAACDEHYASVVGSDLESLWNDTSEAQFDPRQMGQWNPETKRKSHPGAFHYDLPEASD
jgi:hypothetical protein